MKGNQLIIRKLNLWKQFIVQRQVIEFGNRCTILSVNRDFEVQ